MNVLQVLLVACIFMTVVAVAVTISNIGKPTRPVTHARAVTQFLVSSAFIVFYIALFKAVR